MTQKQCQFDHLCIMKQCPFEHSYSFPIEEYQKPQQPVHTVYLPCYFENWLYIKRAISTIENKSHFSRFIDSLLTSDKDKLEKIKEPHDLKIFQQLTKEEIEQFETSIIPLTKDLIVNHQTILSPQPIILDSEGSVKMTRKQCACMLSCLSYGLFSIHLRENERSYNNISSFPSCFFANDNVSVARSKCLLNYFMNISKQINNEEFMNEIVEYQRHSVELTKEMIQKCDKKIIVGTIENEKGIMDFNDEPNLKADFANQYIGGGVLHGGCVQEEIMFMESPEALCSMVFCTVMDKYTSIRIKDMIRYSKISGYGGRIKFGSDLGIQYRNTITAMDAIVVMGKDEVQYQEEQSLRDMNKVYSAIDKIEETEELIPFITGKWGCGAFRGNWEWKYIQQMIVCSMVGRPFVFTTFHEKDQMKMLERFNEKIKNDPPTVSNFMEWVDYMIENDDTYDLLTSSSVPTGSQPFDNKQKKEGCVIV